MPTGLLYDGTRPTRVTADDRRITGELGDEQINVSRWTRPPHLALANLPLDSRALEAFIWKYGALKTRISPSAQFSALETKVWNDRSNKALTPTEMLNRGVKQAVRQDFSLSARDFAEAQNTVRLAWHGDSNFLDLVKQSVRGGEYHLVLPGDRDNDQVLVGTRELWRFTCFLFFVDYLRGKTKICANDRSCPTPYFIQQRKDQEYCSHSCAVIATNARRASQKVAAKKRGAKR
jgi:hypothetical protein